MLVIEWSSFLENGLPLGQKHSSVTVGVFDGVHRGHRSLIERIVLHNTNNIPTVFTFRQNHKTEALSETTDIQTFQQRLEMFENLGIQITVVIEFTESFRQIPGNEFLKTLLKHGSIGFFAVGSSFYCGHRLDTNAQAIKKFFESHNIPAEIIAEVTEDSLPISSSRIRSAIVRGDIRLAEAMLGRSLPK